MGASLSKYAVLWLIGMASLGSGGLEADPPKGCAPESQWELGYQNVDWVSTRWWVVGGWPGLEEGEARIGPITVKVTKRSNWRLYLEMQSEEHTPVLVALNYQNPCDYVGRDEERNFYRLRKI